MIPAPAESARLSLQETPCQHAVNGIMFFLSAGLQVNAGGTGTAASRVQVPAMLLIIKVIRRLRKAGITRYRKPSIDLISHLSPGQASASARESAPS
jgi:hypothetical protein